MELALQLLMWATVCLCCYIGGAILLCWVLFAIAWFRGELTDDTTPAQILERLTAAKTTGAKQ